MIVTHNLQQAGRVGDYTAFLSSDSDDNDDNGPVVGRLVEFGTTKKIFSRPDDKRTEDYVTGRFG